MPTALLRAQSDERLARLAAAGSERAFEAIVERYRRPLMGYARRIVGDSRAEDVVQAALMGAWKQLQDGAAIHDLRAWLYRVVHNGAVNAVKRASSSDLPLLDGAPARDLDLQDQVEHRETVRQALGEIAALPAQQRTALLAVCVQGRRHRDIGRELGVSEGAVRMLIHRARSSVRTAATALTPWPLAHWLAGNGRAAELGGAGAGAGLIAGGTLKAAALIAAAGVAVTAGPPAVEAVQHHARHTAHASHVAVQRAAVPSPPRTFVAVSAAGTHAPAASGAAPGTTGGRRTDTRPATVFVDDNAPLGSPVPETPAQFQQQSSSVQLQSPSQPVGAERPSAPSNFLAPAGAPKAQKPAAPSQQQPADPDIIPVVEDPPDIAAGEQPIGPDGVPDQYIPPDTPSEIADEQLANSPDTPADASGAADASSGADASGTPDAAGQTATDATHSADGPSDPTP
ncbi:MAG TPA: sigma-70 family RNA polymerase sigma factor [Solirubrobacteraceae bacterium]|nr:sigma-70 family RNA polymerase sigma factor [Solirubrobacteraceae bacterium]